jgi:DNA-binding XRE family transcriptional regulator
LSKSKADVSAVNKALGSALRSLRDARGFSQDGMGEFCGLNRTHICLLEGGKQSPNLRTLITICNHLDIDLVELFTLVDHYLKQG